MWSEALKPSASVANLELSERDAMPKSATPVCQWASRAGTSIGTIVKGRLVPGCALVPPLRKNQGVVYSCPLTQIEDLPLEDSVRQFLKELYATRDTQGFGKQSQEAKFSSSFHIGKSPYQLGFYLAISQLLRAHCQTAVTFESATEGIVSNVFYPVHVKLGESESFFYIDATVSYDDAIKLLAMRDQSSLKSAHSVGVPSSARAGEFFGIPDTVHNTTLRDEAIKFGIADVSCFPFDSLDSDHVGSLVFGAVAAMLSTNLKISFPLAVDISLAESNVYIGSRPSEILLEELGPAFSQFHASKLHYADTSSQSGPGNFGERIVVPVTPDMPVDAQSFAGVDDGFTMRVHIPSSCVVRNTRLVVNFPKLRPDLSPQDWILQPFRVHFEDGSQPLQPILIYAQTVRNVKHERLELFKWNDADFHGPVDALHKKHTCAGRLHSLAYFALDDPTCIYAEINHLSVFQFRLGQTLVEFDAEHIDEAVPFSRGYDNDHENGCLNFKRGSEKYILPAKFYRTALNVGSFQQYEQWAVGLHGTPDLQYAKAIITTGFRLPDQVIPGHIALGTEFRGIRNWAHAIFLSPSHKYCMQYGQLVVPHGRHTTAGAGRIYGRTGTVNAAGEMIFAIIQCRVRPNQYLKTGKTGTTWNGCDPRVQDDEIEYRVPNPQDIKPYGLLMRAVPLADVHRTIYDQSML